MIVTNISIEEQIVDMIEDETLTNEPKNKTKHCLNCREKKRTGMMNERKSHKDWVKMVREAQAALAT